MRLDGWIRLGLIGYLVYFSCAVWAVNLIVMEARGGGFKIGQNIDSDKPLTLKDGERVTLIGPDGSKIALRGPFSDVPVQKTAISQDPKKALVALVANREARTSTAGVIRAATQVDKLPDPWLIDVSRSGARCIQQGASPVFWRPNPSQQSVLVVAPADRSFKTEWVWPAGVDRLTIPASSRLQSQSLLRVELDGQEFAIGLAEIPLSIQNPLVLVAWLAEKGCLQQSDALLTQLQGATP